MRCVGTRCSRGHSRAYAFLAVPNAKASLTAPRSGGGPRQSRAAVWCHDRCRCSTALGVRSLMLTARCSYCTTCRIHQWSVSRCSITMRKRQMPEYGGDLIVRLCSSSM
jgi:hypothetical protein